MVRAMDMALQQIAAPRKRPSKPTRRRKMLASPMGVAAPVSHIAASDGPGWATQVAPAERSDAIHAAAAARIAAATIERTNHATPAVIAAVLVASSRMRTAAAESRTSSAPAAKKGVHGCRHQTTK